MATDERAGKEPRVLIAICTLNEAANIEQALRRLRAVMPRADVLVVDDLSPDGTGEIVAKWASRDPVVSLIVRNQRGLGGAIRRAMQEAVDQEYDFFINLDGDLSHDPDQLPSLLSRALSTPTADVVVGSRYVAGGEIRGWPFHRRLMSRIVNRFATLCLRLPVADCSGSMRCYRVAALEQIDIGSLRSNGYAILEEILQRLHRNAAPMAEVPITFTERRRGKSKLTLREAFRSAGQIIGMAFQQGHDPRRV